MRRLLLVLCLLGSLATVPPSWAQTSERLHRVGVLVVGPAGQTPPIASFRRALDALGWIEDRSLALVVRDAGGDQTLLPVLAAELVAAKVEAIVAFGTAATRAAREATASLPIVMVGAGDPLGSGLVSSLSRPGGNVTGVTNLLTELAGKQLEVLKEVVPHARKVAVLRPRELRGSGAGTMAELDRAAAELGVELLPAPLDTVADLSRRFDEIVAAGADAYFVITSPAIDRLHAEIAALALRHRLPGVASEERYVEAGVLLFYGARPTAMSQRAAALLHKILKGAAPAELPVEEPTTFDLAINLRTARALGLAIPSTLLARADEVIE